MAQVVKKADIRDIAKPRNRLVLGWYKKDVLDLHRVLSFELQCSTYLRSSPVSANLVRNNLRAELSSLCQRWPQLSNSAAVKTVDVLRRRAYSRSETAQTHFATHYGGPKLTASIATSEVYSFDVMLLSCQCDCDGRFSPHWSSSVSKIEALRVPSVVYLLQKATSPPMNKGFYRAFE